MRVQTGAEQAILTTEPFLALSPAEVAALVGQHGTPLFVYDDHYFRSWAQRFTQVWRGAFPNSKVYLSYKTNYLPALCRTAHELGIGADVVSGYELEHASRLCPAGPLCFNGPQKRADELEKAVKLGATINIDLEEEIETLERLRKSGRIDNAVLGLRVNPGQAVFSASDESFISAHTYRQRTSKFGWPIRTGEARRLAERLYASGFSFRSLHAHLNSQITDERLFLSSVDQILDFVVELRTRGVAIEELNLGGGYGVPGMQRKKHGWWSEMKQSMNEDLPKESHQGFNLPLFVNELAQRLSAQGLGEMVISAEPGRYLMSASMVMCAKVLGIKRIPERTWVVMDGGLNIMPTAAFGEKRRLRFFRKERELNLGSSYETVSLGGPLCYEGDVIMAEAVVPTGLKEGDVIAISDAGAYTVSRSTNFNQPRAAVAMRDGSTGTLAWRRESYDDIFNYAN